MLSDASARKRRKAGRASVSSAVAEAAQAVTASATALSALSKPQSGDAHKFAADNNNSDFPGNFAMIFTVIALTAALLYIWRKDIMHLSKPVQTWQVPYTYGLT